MIAYCFCSVKMDSTGKAYSPLNAAISYGNMFMLRPSSPGNPHGLNKATLIIQHQYGMGMFATQEHSLIWLLGYAIARTLHYY